MYKGLKQEELETTLFYDNQILLDIYNIKNKSETKENLKVIMNKINSINYINLNIEILDYLGNVSMMLML